MNYIEALQDAIRRNHGCDSVHIDSIPVHEQFKGQTVWEGVVEVFSLTGHSTAAICYAWGHHTDIKDKPTRYITVLAIPPIDSPIAAVRASIVSDTHNAN